MGKKLTQDEFIKKAQLANLKEDGTPKYIYDDKCIYINKRSKVTILCPIHGYFKINAGAHMIGEGCKECGLEVCRNVRRKTKEEVQKDLDEKFNFKYEIIGEYKGNKINTQFRCRDCGYEFTARTNDVLSGRRVCKKCYLETIKFKYTKDELAQKFAEIYNNKYDYSNLEDKIYYLADIIEPICPIHGKFKTNVRRHLKGQSCYECNIDKLKSNRKIALEEIKKRIFEANPNLTFNEDDYVDTNTPIEFTCLKCGNKFKRNATKIVYDNARCPNCESDKTKLEEIIDKVLKKYNFEYIYQCSKKDLDFLCKKSLDFYLPKHKIAIECQGIQHFKPIEHFGGEEGFKERLRLDEEKRKLCEDNGIKILYFSKLGIDYPYNVIEDEDLLIKEIDKSKII